MLLKTRFAGVSILGPESSSGISAPVCLSVCRTKKQNCDSEFYDVPVSTFEGSNKHTKYRVKPLMSFTVSPFHTFKIQRLFFQINGIS